MNHYWVTSPEMSETVPVLDYGQGPKEYFHAVCCVEAVNKADAKAAAVKHPKMQAWVSQQRSDGANPFVGLQVENARCEHGKCSCDMCNEDCDKCLDDVLADAGFERLHPMTTRGQAAAEAQLRTP
jgi:hypothetical protein